MRLRLVVNTMVEMNRDLARCEETAWESRDIRQQLGVLALLHSLDKDVALPKLGSETQKSPTFEGVGLKCRVLIASIYSHRLSM